MTHARPLLFSAGTLVPPFVGVRVDEVVDLVVDNDGDGKISPGDIVQYTVSETTRCDAIMLHLE
jgi:hypothetical protein